MVYSFPPPVTDLLSLLSLIIESSALILLIAAVVHSLYRILRIEVFHNKRFHEYEHTKRTLIQKVIFALDFLVVADIIRLAILFEFMDILKVALIVVMRTMLSWSLSKEIHLHKE
ncbi:DUF1622 domain-containing protein [Candidatus Micrarchaeota archaeon]|nr:DUF1622 domain-containing protein [Candidatus Micrarchaeota archaeon]